VTTWQLINCLADIPLQWDVLRFWVDRCLFITLGHVVYSKYFTPNKYLHSTFLQELRQPAHVICLTITSYVRLFAISLDRCQACNNLDPRGHKDSFTNEGFGYLPHRLQLELDCDSLWKRECGTCSFIWRMACYHIKNFYDHPELQNYPSSTGKWTG
jgi:hypothetical protein